MMDDNFKLILLTAFQNKCSLQVPALSFYGIISAINSLCHRCPIHPNQLDLGVLDNPPLRRQNGGSEVELIFEISRELKTIPALQAATILVAMASRKKNWRPKLSERPPIWRPLSWPFDLF